MLNRNVASSLPPRHEAHPFMRLPFAGVPAFILDLRERMAAHERQALATERDILIMQAAPFMGTDPLIGECFAEPNPVLTKQLEADGENFAAELEHGPFACLDGDCAEPRCRQRKLACTVGTCGLRGCSTSETPAAKKVRPSPGMAAAKSGLSSPCTAEVLTLILSAPE